MSRSASPDAVLPSGSTGPGSVLIPPYVPRRGQPVGLFVPGHPGTSFHLLQGCYAEPRPYPRRRTLEESTVLHSDLILCFPSLGVPGQAVYGELRVTADTQRLVHGCRSYCVKTRQ